jgi:hypothetical protein
MELTRTSFSGSTGSNSVVEPLAVFQLGDAIGLAASRSGLSHKQLCAYMDNLDRGTWSKQLDGDGHISLGRLLKCPPVFWLELLPLLADHFGVRVVEHGAGMGPSIARALIVMADVVARLELHAEQSTRRVG